MAKKARAYSRQTLEAASLLGLRIRQARLERRWSLAELSERAGVSQPTLGKVERGDPTVGLGVAFDVAAIVGVPLFFEEPGRLAPELARQRELIALLPRRIRDRDDDVDDDF